MHVARSRGPSRAYVVGDYAAGAATALAAAAPIHALVDTGWDLVLAMLVGVGIGTLAHLAILAVAGPLVGFFQVMAPGGVIGMYGGMLFSMRDSMQAVSWPQTLAVAILFGLCVVACLDVYDRALRRSQDTG